MMPPNIPPEILSQIADNLSTEDRLSGSVTCKAWRYPFQDSLWRDIQIDSTAALEQLYNSIKSSTNTFTPHGFMVHSLRLISYYKIPDEQQDAFFSYLPNLKYLDLENLSCRDINLEMAKSNKTWVSLKSLIIEYNGSRGWPTTNDLISLLETCPMLKKLEFSTNSLRNASSFGLREFDSIHQTLQQLSHFKAYLYFEPEIQSTLDIIPNTLPATTMTALDIWFFQLSHDWLYYFTYKYPNLQSLRLDTSELYQRWTDHTRTQRVTYQYPPHSKGFQRLETLELVSPNISEWTHLVFWEFIYPLKAPIKNLKYKAVCDHDDSWLDAQLYATDIKRILQSFSETLETLSIEGTVFFDIKHGPALELSSYAPFLMDLHIKSCGISINLDNLLDNCISLKRLRYTGGQLLINSGTTDQDTKEQHQNQGQHRRLRILELQRVVTSVETFSRLSFRCRHLKYMNLSSLLISGSISKKTGRLLLDMPYTFFKAVRLAHIRYRSPYKRIYGNTIISITLLSQLSDPLSQLPLSPTISDKAIQSEQEKGDPESLAVVTRKNIAWFHTFLNVVFETDTRIGIRQLSEQEAITAVEYYENFQSNTNGKTIRLGKALDGNNPKKDWENHLCRGYGELRCGQVEKYILPSQSKHDRYFWDLLYENVFL
ncbi:hypothetical protein F4703DRAFT_1980875 [Phycomyces blakesleeanus]